MSSGQISERSINKRSDKTWWISLMFAILWWQSGVLTPNRSNDPKLPHFINLSDDNTPYQHIRRYTDKEIWSENCKLDLHTSVHHWAHLQELSLLHVLTPGSHPRSRSRSTERKGPAHQSVAPSVAACELNAIKSTCLPIPPTPS